MNEDLAKIADQLGDGMTNINDIRYSVVSGHFQNNPGKRALLLIFPFPFLIIGKIVDVVSDFVVIKAEVTNVTELDDEEFRVHLDDIEVFYIEQPDGSKIPDIRTGKHA
ncbi:hypothetical protein [Lysinibacillus sp. BW-2-10]|uniref:hypothetical protein n=1 Tax=Lysinibacillus sp. BW-2-10 TaxID=2590030 RepID=UPI00117EA87E|nr:hypothetical protein [Lysinibacillus sp. BW-2-10]TSI06691.1 hypothetical protein FJQ64_10105 [Lysinibacillus sp. BW-2-10]